MTRQVLAEPTPDLVERTWASLADGTPLVTGARRDKGTLVLFHVTPEATWSNLPISGSFVEMLRRIVQLSRNQGAVAANAEGQRRLAGALPHDRRRRRAGAADAGRRAACRPAPAPLPVTIENPPGLYGTEEGVFAHNLLAAGRRASRRWCGRRSQRR